MKSQTSTLTSHDVLQTERRHKGRQKVKSFSERVQNSPQSERFVFFPDGEQDGWVDGYMDGLFAFSVQSVTCVGYIKPKYC